jgi:hypothetical protein
MAMIYRDSSLPGRVSPQGHAVKLDTDDDVG